MLRKKPWTWEVNGARALSPLEARPTQHLFHYDSFQRLTPPSPANKLKKTLEVAFWKEKTYILVVLGLKIIKSLWLISSTNVQKHIPVPRLYWSERGYLLLAPELRGCHSPPKQLQYQAWPLSTGGLRKYSKRHLKPPRGLSARIVSL